jgi:hypothetical protein
MGYCKRHCCDITEERIIYRLSGSTYAATVRQQRKRQKTKLLL